MANTYIRILLGSGGVDDKRVKVSGDDSAAGFLEEKIVAGSSKVTTQTLNPGLLETFEIDIDETQIDHDALLNFEVDEHRPLDDSSTTTTSLWSSTKIQTELDGKINAATPIVDNTLIKSVGTSGVDVEATGIVVDDSDNVTGINDLTIDGNLTVNGTTTTVNTDVLDVEDANITINNGGSQASADAADAGLTVEMSDATDVRIGYDSTTTSRMRVGDVGDEREIATISHTQSLTNKTVDADNNTISNLETDNLKAGVLETDLNNAVDNTNLAGAQAIKDYVAQELATQDEASEISYDNSTSGLTAIEVQGAIDEVEGRLDTAESSLSAHLDANPGKHAASQINNTPAGGISATDVQGALDELDTEKFNSADFDSSFDSRLATKDTDDLTEGSALYFTDERAQDAVGTILQDTEIQLTYDDITPQITASLDTTGRTALTSGTITNSDELIIYDVSALDQKKITYGDFTANVGNLSPGDKKESSANFNDNEAALTGSGIIFANGTVRSFSLQLSIVRGSTYELVFLEGIQKGSGWDMSVVRRGDDTGINFDINSSGEILYTSTSTGTSATAKLRADTTSV
jgi:hypothetical protein